MNSGERVIRNELARTQDTTVHDCIVNHSGSSTDLHSNRSEPVKRYETAVDRNETRRRVQAQRITNAIFGFEIAKIHEAADVPTEVLDRRTTNKIIEQTRRASNRLPDTGSRVGVGPP